MSAQQRDSRSRGQMSTTTGSPAAIAPWPDSCPTAAWAPWETITSSGRSQPCSSQTAFIAARTPSLVRSSPPARISRAAAPIAASAAFCARRNPSSCAAVLTRRRPTNADWSTRSSMPAARRWSATATGKPNGTIAEAIPSCRTARSATSTCSCSGATPPATSSSLPSALGSMISIPGAAARALSASSTEITPARRPSTSAYRNGSTMPAGTAWKRFGSASGAPYMRTLSGMRDHFQALEHGRYVAEVIAVVEDRVEVELDARLGLEQLAQRRAGVPRLLGEALDDPVRVVALHGLGGMVDEGEQDPLGEQRAARELEVGAHAIGVDDHAAHDAQREVLHVVEEDRRVRQDHALGTGVRDVALVPQRDVLHAGLGVAAQHPREAADALRGDRVALVGHGARALLAGAEGLLDLAHLRALEVTDLLREALEPGAGQRDRLQQLGVAVARDDLGRDGLGREAEAPEHPRLEIGAERRVRADRARDRSGGGLGEGPLEALGVAVGLEREPGQLEPEARRLGVHAVGAADADEVGELARPLGERGGQL